MGKKEVSIRSHILIAIKGWRMLSPSFLRQAASIPPHPSEKTIKISSVKSRRYQTSESPVASEMTGSAVTASDVSVCVDSARHDFPQDYHLYTRVYPHRRSR